MYNTVYYYQLTIPHYYQLTTWNASKLSFQLWRLIYR